MELAKHIRQIEQSDQIEYNSTPHIYEAPPTIDHAEQLKAPLGVRERMHSKLGQRMVQDAIEHRATSLNSDNSQSQETIFPDFNTLDQAPQTD